MWYLSAQDLRALQALSLILSLISSSTTVSGVDSASGAHLPPHQPPHLEQLASESGIRVDCRLARDFQIRPQHWAPAGYNRQAEGQHSQPHQPRTEAEEEKEPVKRPSTQGNPGSWVSSGMGVPFCFLVAFKHLPSAPPSLCSLIHVQLLMRRSGWRGKPGLRLDLGKGARNTETMRKYSWRLSTLFRLHLEMIIVWIPHSNLDLCICCGREAFPLAAVRCICRFGTEYLGKAM